MRIPEQIKELARAVKYRRLLHQAEHIASRTPRPTEPTPPPMAFIVGSGRSGTTILGKTMASHREVCYLFEPYHLWAAVDPSLDLLNLFYDVEPRCLVSEERCTPRAKARFARQISYHHRKRGGGLVIEKTPINAVRIGYIRALAHDAKIVHLVRDGVDVAQSIARIASNPWYKIAGKPLLNQWWGVGKIKWRALARDGAKAGHFPGEVRDLQTDLARGAYEWLVSLREIDRYRESLGDRLLEIRYPDLTDDPRGTLTRLNDWLGINTPSDWLDRVTAMYGPARGHGHDQIMLPQQMCWAFNTYQDRYGFDKRAVNRRGRPTTSGVSDNGLVELTCTG